MSGTKGAGWDAKRFEGSGTQWVALGQGFLAMPAQLNLVPGEEHRIAHSCLQQIRVAKLASEGRRLAGSAGAGAPIPEGKRVSLKSSWGNFFSSPHSCLSHPCWKLLSSRFCLPPCSSHRCTVTSRLPGPLRWLLQVLAGRRLLPPDLHRETKRAVLDWHGTWHPRYRRGETKSITIAGLHVCPDILCPCTLPWPWGRALEVWGKHQGWDPQCCTHTHAGQAAIPHSCPGGQNSQLAARGICPLCLHFTWPCWGAFWKANWKREGR